MSRSTLVALAGALLLSACDDTTDSALSPDFDREANGETDAGYVITMSNAIAGNMAMVFPRGADGSLGAPVRYPTGGTGTGGGLGNQAAIVASVSGRHVYLVNAGSHSISVFENRRGRLRHAQTIGSGGTEPISIALTSRILYVLNDGSPANITGFSIGGDGRLTPISNSTRPLSVAIPNAAQIGFGRGGRTLVVTEKATNQIVTFAIVDRRPTAMRTTTSNGATPFGFELDSRDRLIVSEAFGGAANASAVSSYLLREGGPVTVSASVPTTESAACWIVITADGRYTYTSNTGSNTISGYQVASDGSLTILDSDGITATTGVGPIDMALSRGTQAFLYSLNGGDQSISILAVGPGGALTPAGTTTGLPVGANGLLAF